MATSDYTKSTVMGALRRHPSGLYARDVAAQCQISESTARNYLNLLLNEGVVYAQRVNLYHGKSTSPRVYRAMCDT